MQQKGCIRFGFTAHNGPVDRCTRPSFHHLSAPYDCLSSHIKLELKLKLIYKMGYILYLFEFLTSVHPGHDYTVWA